jgi:hypothetical protein
MIFAALNTIGKASALHIATAAGAMSFSQRILRD